VTPDTHYRALDMLLAEPPRVGKKPPFWAPKAPPCTKGVRTPEWTWESVQKTAPGAHLITFDVNAAYLAAISSATFAHGALDIRGYLPGPGDPIPPVTT